MLDHELDRIYHMLNMYEHVETGLYMLHTYMPKKYNSIEKYFLPARMCSSYTLQERIKLLVTNIQQAHHTLVVKANLKRVEFLSTYLKTKHIIVNGDVKFDIGWSKEKNSVEKITYNVMGHLAISANIAHYTNLRDLIINTNGYNLIISDSINSCTYIHNLTIYDANLISTSFLKNLPLKVLHMKTKNKYRTIPEQILTLKSLEELYLYDSVNIKEDISHEMPYLKVLKFDGLEIKL